MDAAGSESSGRRGFLKALTVAIGGVIGAVLAVPAVSFLIFPTRKRTVEGPGGFVPVGNARAVGPKPTRVEIVAPLQRDAWSLRENVALGAAWLVKDSSGHIRAFSTTCPHLGCSVDFDPVADRFRCPCHTSAFDKNGDRVDGPAKRGMDPLETQVDDDGRISIRFRRYKPDQPEREEA